MAMLVVLLQTLGAVDSALPAEVRYNRDVLPILADNCFACHGFDKGQRKAGLRLDVAEAAQTRLESGATAIVAGNAGASALVERITTAEPDDVMPPRKTGKHLTEAQKQILRTWIAEGAHYEPHWAFIPPQRIELPDLPKIDHPIDRFIRVRLSREHIDPSPPADRPTLIRRLSLDLTGLPPSPLEVDAFLDDHRNDAYSRVVERLLASEHFGERWARWWLDLAHYADSDGYLQDFIRPVAWRYRQWVVDALNRDMPFDQFTIEQLAGDLLPHASASQRMATGFLRNTLSNREGGADLEEYRVRQVVDRTTTVAMTWLGLTMGCAECHDHKFDPISQREFYQLYAFFNNIDEVNFDAPLAGEREAWELAQSNYDRQRAVLLAPVAAAIAGLQSDWERRLLDAEQHPGADFTWDRALEVLGLTWGQNFGEGQLEGINLIKTPLTQRTREQRERLQDYFLKNAPAIYQAKLKELKAGELIAKIDALKKDLPAVTRAPAVMRAVAPRRTWIHVRGEYQRHGDEVKPATPGALPAAPPDREPSRLDLARWLLSPQHPLTARVTVNRLWQELFGRGIVATSENFGVRGSRPSHPELLDWLAVQFRDRSWSIKEILRLIVTSQTYQQSSQARGDLADRDPQNELMAHQVRMRLSAEAVRDSALAVSGLLSPTLGGPSVKPPQPSSVSKEGYKNSWEPSAGADRYRRGIYTFIQRTSPFAQLVTFDLPDSSRSCSRRERSNTPLQALNLLNDPVFVEAAHALASRVLREQRGTDHDRISHVFLIALARNPTAAESKRLLDYLHQQRQMFAAEPGAASQISNDEIAAKPDETAAWIALCSVLLNLDEFINRE